MKYKLKNDPFQKIIVNGRQKDCILYAYKKQYIKFRKLNYFSVLCIKNNINFKIGISF